MNANPIPEIIDTKFISIILTRLLVFYRELITDGIDNTPEIVSALNLLSFKIQLDTYFKFVA